jgi:hypothetical protein
MKNMSTLALWLVVARVAAVPSGIVEAQQSSCLFLWLVHEGKTGYQGA